MTKRRTISRTVFALACFLLVSGPAKAWAQDALTRAKGLYANADYEEALQVLNTLKGKAPGPEAEAYSVFCLVALGRKDEAKLAIETIVRQDPLFRPAESQVSPRIRAFYDDVRKPLLPEIVRQSYASAKTSFDKKDWSPALTQFERVIALVDELGGSEPGVSDLRTLAVGFRDLTKAALTPAPAPTPTPTPTPGPSASPSGASSTPGTGTPASSASSSGSGAGANSKSSAPAAMIYSDADQGLVRPVAVSKLMPEWRPNAIELKMNFAGTIELIIGTDGKVESAKITKSVNPRYDGPLLESAKAWTFTPAKKDGVPVKYRYSLNVKLEGR